MDTADRHEEPRGVHDPDELDTGYASRVGGRLRAIRRQKGLSLQDVEETSDHEFKASVLGAYERGERAISVPRLQRLAQFYNVPVDQLLPQEEAGGGETHDRASWRSPEQGVTIDLTRLETMSGPEADLLTRYLGFIQVQRQDFNGRVLTIRADDLRAIAAILDINLDTASARLDDLGLRMR